MRHQGVEALMTRHGIRKIWAEPKLLAEYHKLADEMRDRGIAIPPPLHEAAIPYMLDVLASS
jgi:hypothetical protein